METTWYSTYSRSKSVLCRFTFGLLLPLFWLCCLFCCNFFLGGRTSLNRPKYVHCSTKNAVAYFSKFDNINRTQHICSQRNDFGLSGTATLSSLTPSLEEMRILQEEDLDVIFSGLPGSSVAPAQTIHIALNSYNLQTFICSSAKSVKIFSGKGCASNNGFADVPPPRRFGEESLLFKAFKRSSSRTCQD